MANGYRVEKAEFPNARMTKPGWVVVDEEGFWVSNLPYPTKRKAEEALREMEKEVAA